MTEQPLDLRGFARMLRRRRRIVVAAALAGLVGSLAYAILQPPPPSAQALVLLPRVQGSTDGTPRDMKTEIVVATSGPILDDAGKKLHPPVHAAAVKKRVTVSAMSDDVLSIVGRATTAADAVRLANAVADGYVSHVTTADQSSTNDALSVLESRAEQLRQRAATVQDEITAATNRLASEGATSPDGQRDTALLGSLRNEQAEVGLQIDSTNNQVSTLRVSGAQTNGSTRVLQPATTTLPRSARRVPLTGALGLVVGCLAGCVAAAAIDRRDRRLRLRDEIAAAVGVPVLASLTSARCKTVDDFVDLLQHYEPDVVDSWALRRVIHSLERERLADTDVSVMTVAGDGAALAVAVQLATAAADLSIDTALVAPVSGGDALALRGACLALGSSGARPHLVVSDGRDWDPAERRRGGLVITVTTVDDQRAPERVAMGDGAAPRRSLLAVSAGFATAEQLARTALAAADADAPVVGVLVADPEVGDPTTGHLPTPFRATAPSRRESQRMQRTSR